MKKNLYFSVLAAAALFASCSNEMDGLVENTGEAKGVKVAITPVRELPDTRLNLSDNSEGTTWENGDEFSLFYVGSSAPSAGGNLKGSYNAAYETTDGSLFTSKSVLYTGYHALAFPLVTDYVSSSSDIEVAPSTDGEKTLGNRMVYLSKTPVNITANGVEEDGKTYNKNGYNQPVKVTAYRASSYFAFKLKMTTELNLAESDPDVSVSKVQLIASSKKNFATKANLQVKTVDGENRVIIVPANENKTNIAEVVFESPVKLTKEGSIVRIATLPAGKVEDTYKIVVYTNYGVVTIDKAKDVTNKEGKIQVSDGPAELTESNANDDLSFDYEVGVQKDDADNGNTVHGVERNVSVDMRNCDINGMEIHSYSDLLAAYRAYDLLHKTTASLTISADADHNFTLTKEAVEAINDHVYNSVAGTGVRLTATSITGKLILDGFGTETYNTIPTINQISNKDLVLAARNNWTIDVKNAATANAWTSVESQGTLKLTESAETAEGETALDKAITNNGGVLEFGGNVTIPVKVTQTNNGEAGAIMNVADGQIVNIAVDASSLAGTVNVGEKAGSTAILATKETSVALTLTGTTNVYGSLMNVTGNTITNKGTINVKDSAAGVIITTNDADGIINVLAKDNLVNVQTNNGYIKLPVGEDFTVNAENMGIANYVVFSGSKLTIEENGKNVECNSHATIVADNKSVSKLVVNESKMVTIPTGSTLTATETVNNGVIRVFGTFNKGTYSGTGTVYIY